MTTRRRRVLFIAEAVTLAHVARAHALAGLLDPAVYDICIAADPRYDPLFERSSFERRTIETIPGARFARAIEKGSPIYDVATLAKYVTNDLEAIDAFEPDVVVGDFRLSLSVSARIARTPYVTITNAGWSPYAEIDFPVPDLPMTKWLGVGLSQKIFDLARPFAFRAHAKPLNQLREDRQLPALAPDIRAAYTDADFILYADLPELFSMKSMPESHAFLGPVLWSPSSALPDWWKQLDARRPSIYVTLGSSGQSRVIPALLEALATEDLNVIVATAGRIELGNTPSNVFVADYLPGAEAAALASLVICNGGSPTCYQAFAAGTPVLGIPTNLDQFLNMQAVCDFHAGLMLRPSNVTPVSVRHAIARLRDDSIFGDHAKLLRDAASSQDTGRRLAVVLDTASGSSQTVAESGVQRRHASRAFAGNR